MCVILHKLKNNEPFSLEDIKKAMETNPDGFSIAKIVNNKIDIYKTTDSKDFLDRYEYDLAKGYLDKIEYIIHCRIATNGKICSNNCHPFENDNYILWHNGIINEFASDKDKVDSEQFLNKYIANKNMKTDKILKRFKENSSSKFIVFRKDTGEIIQSDNFQEYNGNYISNDFFLYDWNVNKYNNYYTSYYDGYGYDDFWDSKSDNIFYLMENTTLDEMSKKELKEYITKLEDYIYCNC